MTWRVFSVCVAIGVWPPWPFGKTDLFMVGFSELVFRLSTTSPSQNYKNWRAIKMNCISQNMFNVWIFDPKSIWIIKQLVHKSMFSVKDNSRNSNEMQTAEHYDLYLVVAPKTNHKSPSGLPGVFSASFITISFITYYLRVLYRIFMTLLIHINFIKNNNVIYLPSLLGLEKLCT